MSFSDYAITNMLNGSQAAAYLRELQGLLCQEAAQEEVQQPQQALLVLVQ
jgi:hypothetical protein